VDVGPRDSGAVKINGSFRSDFPVTCGFPRSKKIKIEAVPAPGHAFVCWSGGYAGHQNPAIIKVVKDQKIIAHFSR
jgi:hypothetical protein